jgi:hypothetical protein
LPAITAALLALISVLKLLRVALPLPHSTTFVGGEGSSLRVWRGALKGLKPILIEREGSTGLLVTTTSIHVDPESETRLLALPVTDTAEQTRAVLASLADQPSGSSLERWHALQTWLFTPKHRVHIAYAKRLAGLISPGFRAPTPRLRCGACTHTGACYPASGHPRARGRWQHHRVR